LRPKYGGGVSTKLSLGALLDMYHTREATLRHDKIYALLGMSSDKPYAAGILPDYKVPWHKLFQQVVQFILHKDIQVLTWEKRELAIIKIKGCVIGHVYSNDGHRNNEYRNDGHNDDGYNIDEYSDDSSSYYGGDTNDGVQYDRQRLEISFTTSYWAMQFRRQWGTSWTIQVPCKLIQPGDLVCFLQGASWPTIIRLFEDHFSIIVLAASSSSPTVISDTDRQGLFTKGFSRDFVLLWNWEGSQTVSGNQAKHEISAEIEFIVPEYSMTACEKQGSLYDMALILQDAGKYELAENMLQAATTKSPTTNEVSVEDDLQNLTVMENRALLYKRGCNWERAEDLFLKIIQTRKQLQGEDHLDTLKSTVNLAATYRGQYNHHNRYKEQRRYILNLLTRIQNDVEITDREASAAIKIIDEKTLKVLLDLNRENFKITEAVIEAAAKNKRSGKEVITLLLDMQGEEYQITERVLVAAAGDEEGHIIKAVLDRPKVRAQITNKVLEAVGQNQHGADIVKLVLDRQEDTSDITEELLLLFARNFFAGGDIFQELFDRRGDEIVITEDVLETAVDTGGALMRPLLERGGDKVQFTQEMLEIITERLGFNDMLLMKLLLKRRADKFSITEVVLKNVAGSHRYGELVMRLICQNRKDEIQITEGVVKAAEENDRCGLGVIRQINKHFPEAQIPEENAKLRHHDYHTKNPFHIFPDDSRDYWSESDVEGDVESDAESDAGEIYHLSKTIE